MATMASLRRLVINAHSFSRKINRSRISSGLTTSLLRRQERHMSSDANNLVLTSVDDKTGIATVKLNRKPVNSLSHEMLTQIVINLEKLNNDRSIKGAILTSNVPGIFSAGLDIMEFQTDSRETLGEFWRSVQEMWIQLYGLQVPIVAAINGHSPAGGCLMAMACDYRVMASGKFTIGLNETQLGIVAPWWFISTMENTVGHRETERSLQLGHMYDTESALKVGMIDQIVEPSNVLIAAEQELAKWVKIPAAARIITKNSMRKHLVEKLQAGRDADIKNFVDFMMRDSVQKMLKQYIEMLKKKAEAKAQK